MGNDQYYGRNEQNIFDCIVAAEFISPRAAYVEYMEAQEEGMTNIPMDNLSDPASFLAVRRVVGQIEGEARQVDRDAGDSGFYDRLKKNLDRELDLD